MNSHFSNDPFERQVTAAIGGYRTHFDATHPLKFATQDLTADQVILNLHETIDLNEAARVAKAKLDAILELRARRRPANEEFYAEAMLVARGCHGSDPKKMASFGATPEVKPCRPSRSRKPDCDPQHSGCGAEKGCRGGQETVVNEEEVLIVVEETTCEVEDPPCEARCSKEKPPKRGSRGRGRRC